MNGVPDFFSEIVKSAPDIAVILFVIIITNFFNHRTFNITIKQLSEQHKNTIDNLQKSFDTSSAQLRKNYEQLSKLYYNANKDTKTKPSLNSKGS